MDSKYELALSDQPPHYPEDDDSSDEIQYLGTTRSKKVAPTGEQITFTITPSSYCFTSSKSPKSDKFKTVIKIVLGYALLHVLVQMMLLCMTTTHNTYMEATENFFYVINNVNVFAMFFGALFGVHGAIVLTTVRINYYTVSFFRLLAASHMGCQTLVLACSLYMQVIGPIRPCLPEDGMKTFWDVIIPVVAYLCQWFICFFWNALLERAFSQKKSVKQVLLG